MKVLFIGGTGLISSACVDLAVAQGFDVTLLNRGLRDNVTVPAGVKVLIGDIRNKAEAAEVLNDLTFDVVAEFIAFGPEHIETDLELFRGKTKQYIFISSASAYQKPPRNWPVTESTPLHNPYWHYSRQKIVCEELLVRAYREENFPITIVRPSHTYSPWSFPLHGGHTVLNRMRAGKPIVLHGDGESLWCLTHHRDFAKGFVGLLGNPHAIGESVHITSDDLLTWNQIAEIIASAAGVEAKIVHVASDRINEVDAGWGEGILGDKMHSMIFDNSKIKKLVPGYAATIPFPQGAAEMVAWYDSHPALQVVDEKTDQLIERLITAYGPAKGK
ncbi:MAG: SDR family oxidoreductase [Chloroflexi bacterium]|nr:SDR family oxidoreductase [Chloroflexota bacterium]OJV95188.1 MAG: NAD-dependent dehydratase [Chloroflexi bacterium 54-19]